MEAKDSPVREWVRQMKILAYRGKSLISKAIQWQTRSPYSHVAIEHDNLWVTEAWHVGGVAFSPDYRALHSGGTKVDVFGIDIKFDQRAAEDFLAKQIGKKYDFSAIARFISRRDEPADDKWFCSELVLAAMPFLLRHIPPSHTTPRDITLSPYLTRETSRVV